MKLNNQRIFALTLLALLVALCSAPVSAQVSEFTLDNGLRLVVAESHDVPIVAVDVWVKAGTRRETSAEPGVAHFLEHLLFKGTPTHPTEESVDGTIEDLGGSLDAATSWDWAHFYTEIPSSGDADAIGLLSDVLQHSSITTDSVEQERPVILDEIAREGDDPASNIEDIARSQFYSRSSPYGRPITGTSDQVRAVTRDQVLAFYKEFYVPNNVTVVVTGDVNPSDIQKIVTTDFSDWKRSDTLPDEGGADTSTYAPKPADGPGVSKLLVQSNADESYLVMAFDAPNVSTTPDAWDMDVLLTLLGQGGNNRLNTDLKIKRHLVTTISADYLTQRDPGVLTISASMPTANVDDVEAGILDEVEQLRTTPVSEHELSQAKTSLKASYLFDVDTDSGHADSLGFYDSIDSYMYDVNYLNHIDEVSSADVLRIAQTYLDPDAYTMVLQVPPTDPITAANNSSAQVHLASDVTK